MSSLSGNLGIVLWIGLSVLCWVIYHKLFNVLYFDLSRGLGKELIGCLLVGLALLALVCYVWWVAAILLGIAGLSSFVSRKIGLAVLCTVMIIVVAIVGIDVKKNNAERKTTTGCIEYTYCHEIKAKAI